MPMADVTGTVYAEADGARYPLRLTLRALAALQAQFGVDCLQRMGGAADGQFDFGMAVRAIELGLEACNPSLQPAEVARLTDRIATVDLFAALIAAAFPDPESKPSGNGRRPKAAA